MRTIEDITTRYRRDAADAHAQADALKKKIYLVGTLRLLLFIAGAAGIIYFWDVGAGVVSLIFFAALIPFLVLMRRHTRLFAEKSYAETKAEVAGQELAALDYDTTAFDGGKEFVDPSHLYTYDLDVFGDRSLFQYINRTCTPVGKQLLAAWLNRHLTDTSAIEARQTAVRSLADCFDFRREFRIQGLLYKGEAGDKVELTQWANAPTQFRRHALLRALPLAVGIVNAACIAAAASGWVSWNLFGTLFVLFVVLSVGCFTGKITKAQAIYGKKLQILSTYGRLLRCIERQGLYAGRGSEAILSLSRLMGALDQRNNMLMLVALNGLFFWELRQMMRIEKWKEQYADQLPQWLDIIADVDARCSLATFAYNHPDYIFPALQSGSFCLTAEALGHPLIHRDRCVRNDIDMHRRPSFFIITGANMAGKSTYLRTVGVNYLLACIGAPVCARRMTIHPAQLVTSLRTSDSLTDDESYFFAELKRLKMIIDLLQAGSELFIILDEILKGTNSVDKQKGSLALVRQFMELQANGIIATHDLLLGSLADAFPDSVKNFRFEADIAGDELTFSYRLREGIAENMNATFLMKKMGITGV